MSKVSREVILKITLHYDDTHINDEAESAGDVVNPGDSLHSFNLHLDSTNIQNLTKEMILGAIEDYCGKADVKGSVSIENTIDY